MGTLTQEMLDNDIVNADDLIKVTKLCLVLYHYFHESTLHSYGLVHE